MKIVFWFAVCSVTLIAGILFFAYLNEIIIVLPRSSVPIMVTTNNFQKKNITFFCWTHNRWHKEDFEISFGNDFVSLVKAIIKRWLLVCEQESVLQKKVNLQSVALEGPGHTAYLSFDRNPFNKQSSCYQKVMFIQGLLHTLLQAEISLKGVFFLVQHQPMIDYHLDFSESWPLQGFVGESLIEK